METDDGHTEDGSASSRVVVDTTLALPRLLPLNERPVLSDEQIRETLEATRRSAMKSLD